MQEVTYVIATAAFVIPGGIAKPGTLVGMSPLEARGMIARGRVRAATEAEVAAGNAIETGTVDGPVIDTEPKAADAVTDEAAQPEVADQSPEIAATEAEIAADEPAPQADAAGPAQDRAGRSRRRR